MYMCLPPLVDDIDPSICLAAKSRERSPLLDSNKLFGQSLCMLLLPSVHIPIFPMAYMCQATSSTALDIVPALMTTIAYLWQYCFSIMDVCDSRVSVWRGVPYDWHLIFNADKTNATLGDEHTHLTTGCPRNPLYEPFRLSSPLTRHRGHFG